MSTPADRSPACAHGRRASTPPALRRALNGVLPPDLVVASSPPWPPPTASTPAGTPARSSTATASGTVPAPSPLRARYSHWLPLRPRPRGRCERAAGVIAAGATTSASFRAAGSDVVDQRAHASRAWTWAGESRGEIEILVEGDGFLRHMVRNHRGDPARGGPGSARSRTGMAGAAGAAGPSSGGGHRTRPGPHPAAGRLLILLENRRLEPRCRLDAAGGVPVSVRGPEISLLLRAGGCGDCVLATAARSVNPHRRQRPRQDPLSRGESPQMGVQAHRATQSTRPQDVEPCWYVVDAARTRSWVGCRPASPRCSGASTGRPSRRTWTRVTS